jgi:TonB family protein
MSNIVTRSIFHTAVAERSWKTQVTSIAIHVLVIGAAFAITVPVVQDIQQPKNDHVTLIAPFIPHPHPTIEPPRIRHVTKLVVPTPAPVIPPPPIQVAKTIPPPVIPKVPAPVVQPQPRPEPKIEAEVKPPAPKPEVQIAKAPPAPKPVMVGGFGDPRGVQNSETPKPAPVLMARVGAFDSPTGIAQSGGGGRMDSGAVRQSGFGSVGTPAGTSSGTGKSATVQTGNFGDSTAATRGNTGTVRTAGFGDTVAAAPQQRKAAPVVAAAFTPVEILFKPRPSYTAEARGLHLEGQVSMEVVFQASGAVKVVRIIKGLGHGLDEAAQQAAQQVRFKPANRAGTPVDTNATISITFELS